MYIKLTTIRKPHEIHENLNLMKVNNHTKLSLKQQ